MAAGVPKRAAPTVLARPTRGDGLLLVIGLTAVSTSAPLIAASATPALAIAFWRNIMATGVLAPVALLRCRDELRGLDRREWLLALGAGGLLAAHFATWIPSVGLTSVATSTALVATQPVWAAVISRLRGQPVSRRVWLGIALAVVGAALLTGLDVRVGARALVGDGLAVLGGAFAAAYMTAGAEVRLSVSTTTYTVLCYAATALLLLGVCLMGHQALSGYSRDDWLRLAALTAGAQLLGHSVFNRVLRTTSATVVSLAILFEIPGATLIAAVFLHRTPPLLALPAAVLLMAGVVVVVRAGGRDVAPSIPVE